MAADSLYARPEGEINPKQDNRAQVYGVPKQKVLEPIKLTPREIDILKSGKLGIVVIIPGKKQDLQERLLEFSEVERAKVEDGRVGLSYKLKRMYSNMYGVSLPTVSKPKVQYFADIDVRHGDLIQ